MAARLSLVADPDGGYSVVGKADGLTLVFATVNPSQVAAARFEQGVSGDAPAEPEADDKGEA